MKLFYRFLLVGLVCAFLSTAITLSETDPSWMDWINLFGCVFLGIHAKEMFPSVFELYD